MKITGTEDLRVQKTIETIRAVFEQMILDMDYHEMTVKELCDRAKINKKTFYRYYPTLDDLLAELQMDMSSEYIDIVSRYNLPEEIEKVNEAFFRYSASKGDAFEKITCALSYSSIRNEMIQKVYNATWKKSAWFNNIPAWQQHLVMTLVNACSLEMYIQWVADGKPVSVDELIAVSSCLLCEGLDGFRNPKITIGK